MKEGRKIVVLIAIYCFLQTQIDVNVKMRRSLDEVVVDVVYSDVNGEHSSLLLMRQYFV